MQGDISVVSEVDKGSVFTFTVRLPTSLPSTPVFMHRPHPASDEDITAAVYAFALPSSW
jgi:chemotaxis protein histidine kinase CheA